MSRKWRGKRCVFDFLICITRVRQLIECKFKCKEKGEKEFLKYGKKNLLGVFMSDVFTRKWKKN